MIPLSSKRRLSSFVGISLPNIDAEIKHNGKKISSETSSAKFYITENQSGEKRDTNNEIGQPSSLPEYETWITMGPDGEIVEKRRLEPIPKSQSDSALNIGDGENESMSRVDSILNRTRSIFRTDKLKKSVDFFSSKSSTTLTTETKPTWSPDSDDKKEQEARSGKFQNFSNTGFKAPLKGLQEKLKVKVNDRLSAQNSENDDNVRRYPSKIGFLSDIRNRFGASPKSRKKMSIPLSEEEIARRQRCKTIIIDL